MLSNSQQILKKYTKTSVRNVNNFIKESFRFLFTIYKQKWQMQFYYWCLSKWLDRAQRLAKRNGPLLFIFIVTIQIEEQNIPGESHLSYRTKRQFFNSWHKPAWRLFEKTTSTFHRDTGISYTVLWNILQFSQIGKIKQAFKYHIFHTHIRKLR